jgi:hypothetical protein
MANRESGQQPVMPPAAADKQPLKCNVYEFARNLVSTLTPMFPYVDEGAMVPTIALFYGEPNGDYGYFEHVNTVDEVAIIFGAGETTGRGRAGLVRASARSHGVGNLLTDPDSPDSFSVVTVTQRQSTGGGQNEAVAFTCTECSTELFRQDYDATPPGRGRQRQELGPVGHLHTIVGSANAVDAFNGDAKNRTCPKCGHVNKPFPLHRWGWDRYRDQTRVVREAFESLRETAG